MLRRAIWLILPVLTACGMTDPGQRVTEVLSAQTARLAQIVAFIDRRGEAVDGARIASGAPGTGVMLDQNWREATANLYMSEQGPAGGSAEFYVPMTAARSTEITLNSLAQRAIDATLVCNGKARLKGAGARSMTLAPGQEKGFRIAAGSHDRVVLAWSSAVTECSLKWGEGQTITLLREDLARPGLARLDQTEDSCRAPDPARMDALQAAFYADRWLSQTCAQTTGPVRLLPQPLDALNARIEALTGRRISESALLAGNPDMALDFSRAPKLDLVYVSYLLMRADFSGYLMKRMLAWHAARGTVVRILLTDKLMLDQDRALFEGLAAAFPSVQIQYFEWTRPGLKNPAELIDTLQRTHHIKVFATLSPQPGRSRFIVGGRNIWDGFFFDHPIDLTAYPNLRTYDENGVQGLMYYSIYADFEIELRRDRIVRNFMAHLSTFWHRDQRRQVARPMAVTTEVGGAPRDGVTRHFLSLPWADNQAQEQYFAELFDAAEKEITIVTPFMYPTPTIINAMLRARARGVRVRVVARINSTDPSGTFITAMNHGFVKRWAGEFEVYDYVPGRRMMHTKLILVDGRLSVVTSSNMNRRSFLHDTENGLVFLDRSVTAKLEALVDTYLATANRLEPGGELPPFDRVMNELTDIWQYF